MIYFSMEDSWFFALIQSGNLWRAHRRLFHRFFDASAVGQFDDKVHEAVNIFLRRLSESPEHLLNHVGLYVGLHSIPALSRANSASLLTGKPYWIFDLIDCVRGEHRV